jgi:hypothetical protein
VVIAGDLRQEATELIECPCPERLVTRNPRTRIFQRLWSQPESMDTTFNRAFDKPGLFQHLEVLRNRGLGRAESPAKFAGASGLAARKRMNHRTAGAVSQSSKCVIQTRCISHSHMAIYLADRQCKGIVGGYENFPHARSAWIGGHGTEP